MTRSFSRRRFLQQSAFAMGAAGFASIMPWSQARSAGSLTAVEWGPPYIDATKEVTKNWTDTDIVWELHQGGAAAILAKIKATWPNTPYDVVDVWSPVFNAIANEDWHVPVTVDSVPNLADVPEALITKDKNGGWVNVPRNVNYVLFAVREDIVPFEIKTIEDLFDPRLEGQIAWPSPILNTSLQVTALALANGGDEFNMDPGWKALEKLAKSGNIGRIVATTTDIINSMSSGETSVTFADMATISSVAANFPVTYLSKTDPTLKAFPAVEGWSVLKSAKDQQAALNFVNFLISPENSTAFCNALNTVPASTKATAPDSLAPVVFTKEQMDQFVYSADYGYISGQIDAWVKRFEQDIVPNIK